MYAPKEEAVGPHDKFWMFFDGCTANWMGKDYPSEVKLEFPACLILCSTYNMMERALSARPEIPEFREKWQNGEITLRDVEAFAKWACEKNKGYALCPYDAVFGAISLALAPLYETDKDAKYYIDDMAQSFGMMKFISERIVNEYRQNSVPIPTGPSNQLPQSEYDQYYCCREYNNNGPTFPC